MWLLVVLPAPQHVPDACLQLVHGALQRGERDTESARELLACQPMSERLHLARVEQVAWAQEHVVIGCSHCGPFVSHCEPLWVIGCAKRVGASAAPRQHALQPNHRDESQQAVVQTRGELQLSRICRIE